jgi:hypothetical protein
MTTTLKAIRAHAPCSTGWAKLLKHLNKTHSDDEPLSLLTVLESNGLDDAVWCLRTEPTPERTRRFALAVARRVEHLSTGAKACNDVTERYLNGRATEAEVLAEIHAIDTYRENRPRYASLHAAYAARYAACTAAYAAGEVSNVTYYASNAAAAERQAQEQLFKEIFAELQTVTS